MRPALRLLLFVCPLAFVPAASAWGPAGHAAVARLAEQQIRPGTREAIEALLARDGDGTGSLAQIASWADETRTDTSGPWHYVNFPDGDCRYRAARDCAGGNCVVAQIERQLEVLGDAAAAGTERLEALKYLVHFVGDVHQPLHAGKGSDRGGNLYELQADGEETNLHRLWDSTLIEKIAPDPQVLATLVAAQPVQAGDLNPVAWAEASCRIVAARGFYPPHRLPRDYAAQQRERLLVQLALAGHRLAAVLDRALGR